MPENGLRSGEVADAAGVNVQTLRYYERRGLLDEPNRSLDGHRARIKLAEIDAKLIELTTVRDTLRAALDAGCDDLIACADSPCCPVPFTATIPVETPDAEDA
jgi:MerR family regulatory protein